MVFNRRRVLPLRRCTLPKTAAEILVKFHISDELQTREINLHASLAIFFLFHVSQKKSNEKKICAALFSFRNDEFQGEVIELESRFGRIHSVAFRRKMLTKRERNTAHS